MIDTNGVLCLKVQLIILKGVPWIEDVMSLQHDNLIESALCSSLRTSSFTLRLKEEGGPIARRGRFHSWKAEMEGMYNHKRPMSTITL